MNQQLEREFADYVARGGDLSLYNYLDGADPEITLDADFEECRQEWYQSYPELSLFDFLQLRGYSTQIINDHGIFPPPDEYWARNIDWMEVEQFSE